MTRLALVFVALLPLGCSVYVGPAGFTAAVFGSAYTHRESFTQPQSATATEVASLEVDALKSWTTVALRTYGTVDIEATVDMNSERIALTGDGMSEKMAGVIGQDTAAKLGQIVACSLQPAQPACLGFAGGFSVDSAAGAAAEAAAGAVAERLIAPETPEDRPRAIEEP